MRVRCWFAMSAIVVLGFSHPCSAGEVAGILVRIDQETVTLHGCDNRKLVLRVTEKARLTAAQYLGMTVTVGTSNDGENRAVVFRPWTPKASN
ncbi:MAG: hypothetical protein V2B18_11140 [Pseudomonadota bacterium]|jgi:hypothetical protein